MGWADFTTGRAETGCSALPTVPEAVGAFSLRASTHQVASLGLRQVAIGHAHRLGGHPFHTDRCGQADGLW